MAKDLRKITRFRKKFQIVSMGAAMADIALLLLVFFMATTTTEPPRGVEVTVPIAKTEGADQDSIYISVSKQGEYYYDAGKINLNDLKDALLQRQSEKNKIVAITADKDLKYEYIRRLMETLKKADFLNIVFMSQPKEEKK